MKNIYHIINKMMPMRGGMAFVAMFALLVFGSMVVKAQSYCTPTLTSATATYYISNFKTTG